MSIAYLKAAALVLGGLVLVLGVALAKASRRAEDAELRRRLS